MNCFQAGLEGVVHLLPPVPFDVGIFFCHFVPQRIESSSRTERLSLEMFQESLLPRSARLGLDITADNFAFLPETFLHQVQSLQREKLPELEGSERDIHEEWARFQNKFLRFAVFHLEKELEAGFRVTLSILDKFFTSPIPLQISSAAADSKNSGIGGEAQEGLEEAKNVGTHFLDLVEDIMKDGDRKLQRLLEEKQRVLSLEESRTLLASVINELANPLSRLFEAESNQWVLQKVHKNPFFMGTLPESCGLFQPIRLGEPNFESTQTIFRHLKLEGEESSNRNRGCFLERCNQWRKEFATLLQQFHELVQIEIPTSELHTLREVEARILSLRDSFLFGFPEIGKEIGKGSFGRVHQGKWRGMDCAIKHIFNLPSRPSERQIAIHQIYSEIHHLRFVCFPFLYNH